MNKFGRNYSLSIGTQGGGTLYIDPPFTIDFDITRNIYSYASNNSIRIYNLSEVNRNKCRYNFSNYGEIRSIELMAGYGLNNLPTIFSGHITEGRSNREGVNFVTTLEAMDGYDSFANATISMQFPANTPQSTVISNLAKSLGQYDASFGGMGSYPGALTRGNSYSGSTTDILKELTGGGFFIDNGFVYCLGTNECRPGGVAVINAQSGLLGAPRLEQTTLSFEMIFEPGILPGQLIQLISATDKNYNGYYKVLSVKHRGTISEAVCGEAITTLEMFYGEAELSVINALGLNV